MLDKVKELVGRPYGYTISFTYDYNTVSCIVRKPYYKNLGVYGIGFDDETALNRALTVLEQVAELQKKANFYIEKPSLDKQIYVGGYYREILFEDYEVGFKRTPDSYVITDIFRRDENGFCYQNEELNEHYFKMDKDEFHGVKMDEYRKLLKEGEELYAWDTISCLSGTAGIVIVKDKRIIKIKGLTLS